MGRILFLFMTLTDLIFFFFLSLSLGNHRPLVRRKDLGIIRHSLPKSQQSVTHCSSCCPAQGSQCPGWWLLRVIITETHCLVPGARRPDCMLAPGEGLLAVPHWMGEHRVGNHFYGQVHHTLKTQASLSISLSTQRHWEVFVLPADTCRGTFKRDRHSQGQFTFGGFFCLVKRSFSH